jgi:hypothetical protein
MAQYFNDFEQYALGSGLPVDWGVTNNSAIDFEVTTVSGNRGLAYATDYLYINRYFYENRINALGDIADVDVYVEFLRDRNASAYTSNTVEVLVRSDLNNNHYGLGIYRSVVRIRRLTNGSFSTLVQGDNLVDGLYSMRVRANGTFLGLKTWLKGTAEPVAWSISTTDTTHSTGRIGFWARDSMSSAIFQVYGVGTNGDSAPTSPVILGPNTPVNPSITSLLATSARLNWEQG